MGATGEPLSEYDDVTTVSGTATPGHWEGRFPVGWTIGRAVNGGVVMTVATTALARHVAAGSGASYPDPVAFSGYFLTAAAPGPLVVDTEVLRTGRTLATGQVSLSQPGPDGLLVERMRAMVSFGDLGDAVALRQQAPPAMPSVEKCVSSADAPRPALKQSEFLDRVDLRLDPECAGWAVGRPSGRGRLQGWLRLADGRDADTTALLLLLDAFPPVSFDLGIPGWAPTLEFSAHVRARPAPGWLQVLVSNGTLAGGTMEEDCTIWDSTGRLVAQSRQLCGVRVPPGWAPPS